MPKPSTPICPRCNERMKVPNKGYCKTCETDRQREWRMKNLEKVRAIGRASEARHKGTITNQRTEKTCSICREVKILEEFHRNNGSRDGRAAVCRPCAIKQVRIWEINNPEKFALNQRRHIMKSKYGITLEQYAEMLKAQNGGCSICGRKRNPPKEPLVVDHDHQSGTVRSLLCNRCNGGMGLLGDNPERLRAAADYIEHHRLLN